MVIPDFHWPRILSQPWISNKFTIDITSFSSYCVILNHLVTRSIMVTTFRFKFSFYILILWRRSILDLHIFFHGISSASLASNLQYFIFDHCIHWGESQLFTSVCTLFNLWASKNIWKPSPIFYPLLGDGCTYDPNVIHNFGVLTG